MHACLSKWMQKLVMTIATKQLYPNVVNSSSINIYAHKTLKMCAKVIFGWLILMEISELKCARHENSICYENKE